MIQSMTGYGKSVAVAEGKKIYVEIKSLNSKALDISARVAPPYREKEMEIRAMISRVLERGKVDFAIRVEKDGTQTATPINGVILDNYYRQIRQISDERHIPLPADWFATLLRLPDVMARTEAEELDEILSHHRVPVYPVPVTRWRPRPFPPASSLQAPRSSTSVPPKSAVSSHKAATPLTDWTMRSGRESAKRDTAGKHKSPGRQGRGMPAVSSTIQQACHFLTASLSHECRYAALPLHQFHLQYRRYVIRLLLRQRHFQAVLATSELHLSVT